MKNIKHHKTIVLSDIHLGSRWSKAIEVLNFLKRNSCDTLILCGDIIDGWSIMRGSRIKWRRRHTRLIQYLLSIQDRTKIIYVRGNHDDFLDRILPLKFSNMQIVKEYIHISGDSKYYVVHGDIYDKVTSTYKFISKLGDIGYSLLLFINHHYNKKRESRGLAYSPISKSIKNKVKKSISYIFDFENVISLIAKEKGCDGVICGHIHQVANKYVNSVHYMNSGDWVESLSALTEDMNGCWNINFYYEKETYRISPQENYEDIPMKIPTLA